jgi:hypothetical protein
MDRSFVPTCPLAGQKHSGGQKRRPLAAAPEDFSAFAKKYRSYFLTVASSLTLNCSWAG